MESFPPYPIGPGQRALAAIVFTDVVSFSARMQMHEETTLRLLERDFEVMRKICDKYSGAVLKTTGDGLLLYFSSAVQAVACALRMQKYFADKAKTLPPNEVLAHRVGIHLGDVFVNDQDVMGDGVNIASRLQAEAEPGGICISQTVYDVVKNKLALQVTGLGPRELKNIAQSIPVYRILLAAEKLSSDGTEASMAEPTLPDEPVVAALNPATPPSRSITPGQKLLAASILSLAVVIVIVLVVQLRQAAKQEPAKSEAQQAAIRSLIEGDQDAAGKIGRERMGRALTEWREELRYNRSHAAEEYNFSELAASLQDAKAGPAAKADTAMRQQALERMQALFNWVGPALQRYSRQNPLVSTELTGTAPKEIRVFVGADHQLYYIEGGAVRQRNWGDLKPATMGAIIVGTLLDAAMVPPREVIQGAQIFGHFYGLPEMNETLRKGRGNRGPK
jgi:class 3 adenylate cyclase